MDEGLYRAPDGRERAAVRRSWRTSALWARLLASWLARRETRALRALEGLDADVRAKLPTLLWRGRGELLRAHLAGAPMHATPPARAAWFAEARRLLAALHRHGVAHNDTAKEPNWLVLDDGAPGLIDFQLASVSRRRGRLFRLMAREDLRHLLKHKRTYFPEALTPTEKKLLATPSTPARWVRRVLKPPYTFVTRRLFGWRDDEGGGSGPRA